jgi:hypothetical protein
MTLYSRKTEVLNVETTDFGFVDQKGRKCGYRVEFIKVMLTERDPEAKSGYRKDDGLNLEHFAIVTSPTRNGQNYGPAFNWFSANTLEEVGKVADKRCLQARKRDSKKFTFTLDELDPSV